MNAKVVKQFNTRSTTINDERKEEVEQHEPFKCGKSMGESPVTIAQ
jgi:hypothetical protein